jgi:DNA-binding NarL/FixJ family response regulator
MDNNSGSRAIQVVIVAPAMVCWGLEKLVQSAHPRYELAGSAATLADGSRLLACAIDILVLDLDGGYGPDAVRETGAATHARILALTSSTDTALLDAAVVAGVRGIVRKSDPPAALLRAIERVHAGEFWIDRSAAGRIFVELARQGAARAADPDQAPIATLTARERQTICAIARDAAAPGKVIASRLCISEHTLRNHLSSIYAKLGLANRLDLFAYASKHNLDKAG